MPQCLRIRTPESHHAETFKLLSITRVKKLVIVLRLCNKKDFFHQIKVDVLALIFKSMESICLCKSSNVPSFIKTKSARAMHAGKSCFHGSELLLSRASSAKNFSNDT